MKYKSLLKFIEYIENNYYQYINVSIAFPCFPLYKINQHNGGPGHHLFGEYAPAYGPNTGTGKSYLQLGQKS